MTYFPKPAGDTLVARYAYPGVGQFDPKLGAPPTSSGTVTFTGGSGSTTSTPSKLETGIKEAAKWFLAPFRPTSTTPAAQAAQPSFFERHQTKILVGGGIVLAVGAVALMRRRKK